MAIPSLVRSARGTVLELGPCTGNQVQRLDATRIGHVYGIEPNAAFAATLARRVSEAGLEARYTPVWAPLERAGPELGRLGVARGSVDCVLCIQVACSTRQPEELVRHCWDWLRPGGELIFCEHGASHDALTRVVQGQFPARLPCPGRHWADTPSFPAPGLWNIMWPWFVGGCQLTWSMERCLRAAPWEVVDMQTDETPASLFPRTWGRLRKPLDANP